MEANLKTLLKRVQQLKSLNSTLADDNLFVLWFLRAQVPGSAEAHIDAVSGVSGDNNVDALLVDDDREVIYCVQGKYPKNLNKGSENQNDVLAFARVCEALLADDAAFKDWSIGMDELVKKRVNSARKAFRSGKFTLHLRYVTLNKCSDPIRRKAKALVGKASSKASFEVFDGKRVIEILKKFEIGMAPAVPSLEFPVAPGGAIYRLDSSKGIEAWVMSMNGGDIARLYSETGDVLFASNIRGFLGDQYGVNDSMKSTLKTDPDNFWYFNNGITVICSHAHEIPDLPQRTLVVHDAQIINGLQTTRTLASSVGKADKTMVLVRLFQVSGDVKDTSRFISTIVRSTNHQNPISDADLRANDPIQLDIEKELEARRYRYQRKRMSREESRLSPGAHHRRTIKKEDLAVALGASKHGSLPRLGGPKKLFGDFYDFVFEEDSVDFLLSSYWSWRLTDDYASKRWRSVKPKTSKEKEKAKREKAERTWGKYVAFKFVWDDLSSDILKNSDRFVLLCESRRAETRDLLRPCLDSVFEAVVQTYRNKVGRGVSREDLATYFKRPAPGKAPIPRAVAHEDFGRYWKSKVNAARRARYDKARAKLVQRLSESVS